MLPRTNSVFLFIHTLTVTHKQRNIGRFLFLAALYVGIYLMCMALIGSAVSGYSHDNGRQMLAKPAKADIGLGSIANFKR